MGRFDGKVVLVTGGNRNTGLDIVEKFVREGAKVFMCGSSAESTAKGAEALKARGIDGVVSQPCDVSDAAQVAALFDTIESIRIEASSGLSDDEIKRMKAEAEANANADKAAKERIDKINQADSMIFQTEKQLKELGDKIPADKKAPIESALNNLKEAHKSQDVAAIDKAMEALNNAFHAASEDMYKNAGAGAGQQQANPNMGGQQQQSSGSSSNNSDEVTDVDFEEVK